MGEEGIRDARTRRPFPRAERLAAVAGDAGCHACHTHMSCAEHCPKSLVPTRSIAGLKRATLAVLLMGEGEELP